MRFFASYNISVVEKIFSRCTYFFGKEMEGENVFTRGK